MIANGLARETILGVIAKCDVCSTVGVGTSSFLSGRCAAGAAAGFEHPRWPLTVTEIDTSAFLSWHVSVPRECAADPASNGGVTGSA
jgi:hypothetical protein